MSTSYVAFDISGYWEGTGTEIRINRETNAIDKNTIILKRTVKKFNKNIYNFIDTYYFVDGTLYDGPTSYLVNTDGNIIYLNGDDYGTGIDSTIILNIGTNSEFMRYNYNINGIPESEDPLFSSLNGTYDLYKKTLLS